MADVLMSREEVGAIGKEVCGGNTGRDLHTFRDYNSSCLARVQGNDAMELAHGKM
jgi:hypothetical protein